MRMVGWRGDGGRDREGLEMQRGRTGKGGGAMGEDGVGGGWGRYGGDSPCFQIAV